MIDAGFLELARLGVLPADDADIARSLAVVDATIRRTTDSGGGFFRYNGDGYGDGATDGHPWAPTDKGNGHLWPVLAGERGQYEVDTGDPRRGARPPAGDARHGLRGRPDPRAGLGAARPRAVAVRHGPDAASIGFVDGKPAGSASALTWSAGQFVRLTLDLSARRVLDRPAETTDRYVRHASARRR